MGLPKGKKERIQVADKVQGEIGLFADAVVFGDWGVHRNTKPYKGWMVTHVPSGMSLGDSVPERKAALAAVATVFAAGFGTIEGDHCLYEPDFKQETYSQLRAALEQFWLDVRKDKEDRPWNQKAV